MTQQHQPTRKERREAARAARIAAEQEALSRERRNRRLGILAGVVLGAALIVTGAVLVLGGGDDEPSLQAGESVAAQTEIAEQLRGIPQDGIALGDPDAPVTVVEFADLQCPACAAFSNDVLPTIVQDYVRPGDARLELRTLTFLGPDSYMAAEMGAAAAMQDRLWHFAELFYANQGLENGGYVTEDFLRRIGEAIPGFDVDRAVEDRGSQDVSRMLADADELAAEHGVQGTPTVLVGPTGGELETVEVGELGAAIERIAKAEAPR